MQKIRKHRTNVYTSEHIWILALLFLFRVVFICMYTRWLTWNDCAKIDRGRVGLADPLHKFDTASTFKVNEMNTHHTRRRVKNCDAHSHLLLLLISFIFVFVFVFIVVILVLLVGGFGRFMPAADIYNFFYWILSYHIYNNKILSEQNILYKCTFTGFNFITWMIETNQTLTLELK